MDVRSFIIFTVFSLTESKGLSCEIIKKFVDGHNSRRLLVAQGRVPGQPPALNMKLMVWDEELAAKAAKWADKHLYEHNTNYKVESGRFETGDNLLFYRVPDSTVKPDIDKIVEKWFEEYCNFTYGRLEKQHFGDWSMMIGHYTQVVWANSMYLGCGMSPNCKPDYLEYFIVCYYGPRGNIIGEYPYKRCAGQGELVCANHCNKMYGKYCS